MKWKQIKPKLADEFSRLQSLRPHELLKISSNSNKDEIKDAFHKMIKIYHPDKSANFMKKHNEQVCKLIIKAYHKLILEQDD